MRGNYKHFTSFSYAAIMLLSKHHLVDNFGKVQRIYKKNFWCRYFPCLLSTMENEKVFWSY